MLDQTYTKLYKGPQIAFDVEYECLVRLKNNFECICKGKSNHFPLINEILSDKNKIVMSHCGKSLGLEINNKIE